MDIMTRIERLRGPIIDAGAAIDAARVLANITGESHRLWLQLEGKRWHVRPVGESPDPSWHDAGGAYKPGEERSGIQTDPKLTGELARERGILPMSRKEYDTDSVSWSLQYQMALAMRKAE